MNILLLNNNPVVSRLVSFCIRDTDAVFEEVPAIGDIAGTEYDIVFVDDASYDNEVAAYLSAMHTGMIVFFSGRDSGEEIGSGFDTVIKKPFLPSQIRQVIDRIKEETNMQTDKEESVLLEHRGADEEEKPSDVPFLFPLSDEEKEENEEDSDLLKEANDEVSEVANVLDRGEIAQIKALLEEEDEKIEPLDLLDEDAYEARKIEAITKKLEEDGLEIVREEEILSELSQKTKKKQKKSKAKKRRKKRKKKEETYTMEEALLAAIENMKPKKIKKLLKGADVTIKIRFKDDI